MKFLVLDIETIRHEALWTPPDDKPDMFAPPFAWRPICIGLVLFEGTAMVPRRIGAIDVDKATASDEWERMLLEKFADTLARLGETDVITWNGRAFDLPVLMYRSMRYGIAHPWYYRGRSPRHRYDEDGHCDLADHMADHGSVREKLGLDGMAKLIGLPGKFGDIDGAEVGAAFAQGRHHDITAYCVSDAVQTAFLFLRWHLLKGRLTFDAYRASATALLGLCDHDARLGALVASVDRRVLLLERGEEAAA